MARTSLIFYPNSLKLEKKTGKIPLYLRILHNGKKAEARLNHSLTQSELFVWNEKIMRLEVRNSTVNKALQNIDDKFQELLSKYATNMSGLDVIQIRENILGTTEKIGKTRFLDFMSKYFINEISFKSELRSGTKKNYTKAINHMRRFLKKTQQEDFMISDISPAFANNFKNYLLNDQPECCRTGMTETSALGIIKKFRTMVDFAIINGRLATNSFKLIKLNKKSPRKPKLTIEQIYSLIQAAAGMSAAARINFDIFMFSLFTGLSYVDNRQLKRINIMIGEGGESKLSKGRQKTNDLTEQFLVNQAINLIDKYKTNKEVIVKGLIMPSRSNKTLNAFLKIIAERAVQFIIIKKVVSDEETTFANA